MLRNATEEDLLPLVILRRTVFGGTDPEAAGWIQNIAGLENILVLDLGKGKPAAMLGAVPVTYGRHQGIWFCGAAALPEMKREELFPQLLDGCLRAYAATGCEFAVVVPRSAQQAKLLKVMNFTTQLPQRVLQLPVQRNVLARAAFDNMTVHHIAEMRARHQPGCVALSERAQAETMTRMYQQGITVVSSTRGYGLFYTEENQLRFVEMQADNDHSADTLIQAACDKACLDRVQLTLAENQTLYMGAGRRKGHQLLRFLNKPFPVGDFYFPLLQERAAAL